MYRVSVLYLYGPEKDTGTRLVYFGGKSFVGNCSHVGCRAGCRRDRACKAAQSSCSHNPGYIAMRLYEIYDVIMTSHELVRIQILSVTVDH